MVSKNDIRVGLKFETDTTQIELSKQKLSELTNVLRDIQIQAKELKITGNSTEEIQKAANEAKKLEQILNQSWNSKLGQLDLSKFNNNLKASNIDVQSMRLSLAQMGPVGVQAFNSIASSVLNTNVQLKQSSTLLNKMALTMANTIRFGISSSIFNNLTSSISKAYDYVKKLDKSLNDIRIVSNSSATDMERFAKYANDAAKSLGASTLDYTKGALIYFQQGLDEKSVKERTDITIKMAHVTESTAQEVSDYMTAIWNNFAKGGERLEYFADVLAKLGAETASSAEEISQGLEKFAAVSSTVGLSYEYAAAALTTVTDRTRQSADVVGTAFKTLFARIQDLELGKTLDDGTTLGKYSEALHAVGVDIKDQKGQLKDMDTILNEMGSKWKILNSDQKVALAQNVAGVRQYTQLMALMENWDFFEKNVESARTATGTLQEQQEVYLESVEAHLEKLSTEAEKTYSILFDPDTIKSFADALTNVLSLFNTFISSFGGGLNTITFFAGTLTSILNKQIGGAIERQIENFEIWKTNLNAEELKRKFAEEIANGYTVQGQSVDVNSTQIREEAEVAMQIAHFKESITQEEYNQLVIMQKQMGEAAQKLENAKNYKDLLTGIFNDENVSLATMKKRAVEISKQTKEYEQQQVLLEEMRDAILAIEDADTEDQPAWFDALIELESPERTQALQFTKEELEHIYEILSNPDTDNAEVWSMLDEKAGLINNKLDEQYQTEEDINEAIRRREYLESDEYKSLEQQQKERHRLLDQMDEQEKRQKIINAGVQAFGATVSLITSVSGALEVLNDRSLTAGERIKRLLTSGAIIIPTILRVVKSFKTLIPIEKLVGMTATEMWAQILGPALIVVATIAAVGTAIYAVYKHQHRLDEELNNAKEVAKAAKDELENLKSSYEELKNSITNYQEMEEALKKLTKGTVEWEEKLLEINDVVLNLLDKYPNLIDYIETSNEGYLKINPEGFKVVQEQQRERIKNQQVFSVAADMQVTKAQEKVTTRDFLKNLNFDVDLLSDENAIKFAQVISGNIDNILKNQNEELIKVLENAGLDTDDIEKMIPNLNQSIKDNLKEVSSFNNSMELYTKQVNSYTQTIATILNGNNPKYQNSKNQKYIDQEVGKEYKERYNKELERLNGLDRDQIKDRYAAYFTQENERIWYHIIGKGFYVGENENTARHVTTDEARQQLASQYASDWTTADTDIIIDKIDKYIDRLNKIGLVGGETSESQEGYIYSQNSFLGDFLKKIANNEDVTKIYTESELQKLEDTWNNYIRTNLKVASAPEDIKDENGNIIYKKGEDVNAKNRLNFEEFFGISVNDFSAKIGNAVTHSRTDKEVNDEKARIAKESFRQQSDTKAESLSADANGFYEYTQQLIKNSKALEENDAFAIEASAAHYKLSEKIDTLNKSIIDNEKTLRKWAKGMEVTPEEMEKIGKTITAVKNILGEDISENFVKKHLDEIIKLSNGDISVLDDLQKAMTQDFILDIKGVDKVQELPNELQTLANYINNLDLENIEIGTQLNTDIENQIQELLDKCVLTEDQANTILSGIGYSPKIEQTEAEISNANGETATLTYTDPETLEKKTITNYATTQMSGVISIPVINAEKTRFKGANKNNFKWTPPKDKSGKKSGGGSKSKPQKAEKFNPQEDIYHKVNTQITKVDNSLKKLQRQEEKTLGTKLLKNLQTQWNKLNTQIDNYKEKLKIAEKEQSKLQKKLAKSGVTFNEDGTVANYFETLQKLEDKIEAKRTKYNKERNKRSEKTNKARLEEIEKLKEQYNTLQEEMNRVDELASDFIPENKENIRAALDNQIELNIKEFEIKIKYSADIKDLTTEVNDFIEKSINGLSEDNKYGNFKLNQKNMAASLTKDDNGNLIGHLADQTEQLIKMQAQYDQLRAQGASIFGDNDAEGWEKHKEQLEAFMEEYSGYIEAQKEQLSLIREQKEAIDDLMDTQLENYGKIGDQLEHNRKLMQLVYGESAASKIKEISKIQVANAEAQLNYAHQLNVESTEYLKTQELTLQNAKDQVNKLAAAGDTESSLYQQAYNAMLEAEKNRDEAAQKSLERAEAEQEALNNYVDTINNDLVNAIDIALETLNNGLTENGKGLDYVREQWDLIDKEANIYLDTINSLQGQKDLESKYLESIEKATNPNVQKKLKAAMDAELKALKDKDTLTKYDLDRANKRYQIMLAEIALEEAQQNKNKMRLRRDSQGNYRYQYVADEENIKKAQDELTSLYTDLYNFDKERFLEVNNTILDIEADVQNKIKEIYADTTKSKEEKEQEAALVIQSYNDQILVLQKERAAAEKNVNESAFDDLKMLYGEDSEEYAKACEDKQKTMAELIPQFESEGNAIAYNTELVHKNEDAWHAAETAANNAADTITNKIVALEGPLDQLEQGVNKNIDAINKIIEQGVSKIAEYKTQLTEMNTTLADNQALLKQLDKEKGIVDLVTKSWKDLTDVRKDAMDEITKEENEKGILTTDYGKENASQNIENSGGELEPEKISGNQGVPISNSKITNKFGQPATWTEVKKSKAKTKALQEFLMSIGIELPKYGADGSYGDETLTAVKKFQKQKLGMSSGDGKFGPDTWARAKAAGYDTGGYTGEWGNNGRLAFLHQKELVLNAQDTENILNTVAIMRNLMASMNESILSRLAGVTARSIQGLDSIGNNSGLEQNVHIEANFPNAISSNEIEEALRNLVNVASQRVTK